MALTKKYEKPVVKKEEVKPPQPSKPEGCENCGKVAPEYFTFTYRGVVRFLCKDCLAFANRHPRMLRGLDG